jgi:hypothetical protein
MRPYASATLAVLKDLKEERSNLRKISEDSSNFERA